MMNKQKILYADSSFKDLGDFETALTALGVTVIHGGCKTPEDVIASGSDAVCIVTELIPLGEAVFQACPVLELVYTNNVGTDLIDISAATDHGIRVCNNPDYNFREVAEHTVALLLSLIRKIPKADAYVRSGGYDYNHLSPLKRFEGSTVGLLGFGRIARSVAKKLAGFEVRVLFYDPCVKEARIGRAEKTSLETLLQISDYLCIHAPLTKQTHHLLNAETLGWMKPGAALVNAARGELIDTPALLDALESGRLSGAALDVVEEYTFLGPNHILCGMDNVVLTPHSAWLSEEAFEQCKNDFTNEIVRFFKNQPLKALLNPEVLDQASNCQERKEIMSLTISNRLEWVRQSEIRNMSIECEKYGGLNLSQGVCDLEVPPIVVKGAKQAIDDGINSYTRYDGLNELRQAIAQRQKIFTGMEVDPEKEIVVSSGATGALFSAFFALLNAGDEVIVFEPYYGYHTINLVSTLAVPKYVRMTPPDWTFTRGALDKALTEKTKAILINTPGNPSGKVFSMAELELISDFACQNDLFIFTDEIYEYFVYDDRKHIPPANLPGMRERTIMVSGLSKTYSITGWRIGYCICDARWSTAIGYFSDMLYACAPAPLQMGVAAGLVKLDPEFYDNISKDYQKKRDRICNALHTAGLTPYVPQGAYYVLCDISRVPGGSGKEKAMHLLKTAKVASVPGEAFYHDAAGEKLTRFCFAKEDPILDEACRRIESFGKTR